MPSGSTLSNPGTMLGKRLKALGLTAKAFAKAIGVPSARVKKLLKGTKDITGKLSLRLGRFFNEAPEAWLLSQMRWELQRARRQLKASALSAITPQVKKTGTAKTKAKALKAKAPKAKAPETTVKARAKAESAVRRARRPTRRKPAPPRQVPTPAAVTETPVVPPPSEVTTQA